jgi:hypothetical protein
MARVNARKIKLKTGQAVIIRSARPDDAKGIIEYARIVLAGDLYNVITLGEFKWTIKKEREWICGYLNKVRFRYQPGLLPAVKTEK